MTDLDDTTVEAITRLFHETYERLAPEFSYSTREASAVPWEDVPESNRRLMLATVREVLPTLPDPRPTEAEVRHASNVNGNDWLDPLRALGCFRPEPAAERLCGPTAHGFDCVLPYGHNRGVADVPENHSAEQRLAPEPSPSCGDRPDPRRGVVGGTT